jgi:hypothetical protein
MSLAICANLITAQESQSMKENLNVWLLFLKDYNDTTVMLDQFWSSNSDLELFTDSAGGIGFGIYFNHKKVGAGVLAKRLGGNWYSFRHNLPRIISCSSSVVHLGE